jgi:hypothetical protein
MTTSSTVMTKSTREPRRTTSQPERPTSIWTAARESYRSHRAARAAYARAEQELAAYTTPADLLELSEMLQRSNSRDSLVYRAVVANKWFAAARP